MRDGISNFFVASDGENRSMMLDLRDPLDAARLRALLANADLLVENTEPGAFARLGFDAKRLLALNARLAHSRRFSPSRRHVRTRRQSRAALSSDAPTMLGGCGRCSPRRCACRPRPRRSTRLSAPCHCGISHGRTGAPAAPIRSGLRTIDSRSRRLRHH